MTVLDSGTDIDRPPPKRKRRLSIGTPGVPFYRDITVLRVIAQIVFAVFFVGFIIFVLTTLGVNLAQSNLSLDWGLFQRPFTVSIAEGISLTEAWDWTNNVATISTVIHIIWGLILAVVVYNLYREYRRTDELNYSGLATLAALIIIFLLIPPQIVAESISRSLAGGTVARALLTGIYNTLRVVIASLVATTVLGVIVGVGLLTNNFLVRNVAQIFVEIFRNTPLLVQLVFIDWLLTNFLPVPRNSLMVPVGDGENLLFALNNRGFYSVSFTGTESTWILLAGILIGAAVGIYLRRKRIQRQEQTGKPSSPWLYFAGALVVGTAVGWVLSGTPFASNFPFLQGPNVREGTQISLGFVSVFLGLTLYTSAFVADIVRAGIQAVPFGQIEAARSQGLNRGQVLNLVILPQALRLIVPPMGNQYVNLGKNSSLALVVGYFDTYQIALLANNESGQAVPIFVGLMVIYLSLSLTLSVLTNLVNRTTRVRTR